MRQKRAERIKSLIAECYATHGHVNMIDIGGLDLYWKIIPRQFLVDKKVHITCVNLPGEAIKDKNDPLFTFATGDGCNLREFTDKSFHMAHSNSVIEHVGDKVNTALFAKEVARVAERYYVQTPNYWFPMEPHFLVPFFQWLPRGWRIKLLMKYNFNGQGKTRTYESAKNSVDHCNLLTAGEMKKLFPGSTLFRENIFLLTKSLIVIK